jgi:tetratricopeptide (TPR) repeat protein/tRNA A-37 threonylcarbamoyl transferase component Bud32
MSLWERAQEVFRQALDRPSEERAAFVEGACADDAPLRNEVESLLAHDVGEGSKLDGVFQFAAAALMEEGSLIGQRVGPYRIESELGQGGMGTVYLAVRADDEFQKKVAIKVVKWGMDTRSMLERFRYERQILAGLDHPYIARLLDGGSTAGRQPYFVMEYVQGRSIDRYCREAHLSVPEVCRLFLRVCDAVAYAHRNLVVHRDLKPGNIIVTEDAAPKLLDFGVAKLLAADAAVDATITNVFHRPLTPEYASPEQVKGLSVSTATDVYSLGAVLYELLTGSRLHSVTSNTASEWERAVCDTEVTRPSLKRSELNGDLDNILLMALRKEPERRYSSVEQLASDIQRFLDGRPVAARQDSFRYRAGKYLKRHRVSIAAAGLVAASLLVGTMLAVAEARAARAARAVAEHERALAEDRLKQVEAAKLVSDREHANAEQQRSIADKEAALAKSEQARAERRLDQMVVLANKSLVDVHSAIERLPGATAARGEIIRTTLDYLEKLEKEVGDDPRLRLALGATYLKVGELQGSPSTPNLGDTSAALKSLDRAEMWLRPLTRTKAPDTEAVSRWIDVGRMRAQILQATGRDGEATQVLRGLLSAGALLSRLDPRDGREATLHQVLASALQSHHPAEAAEQAREAVEGYDKLMAVDPKDAETILALSASHSIWASTIRTADPTGALAHFRESVRLREELVSREPNNSSAQRGLMLAYGQTASLLGDSFQLTQLNDVEGARSYYTKALAIARNLAQADPVNTLGQYDLGSAELRLAALEPRPGGLEESLAALRESRAIFEKLTSADPHALRAVNSIALASEYIGHRLRDSGHPEDALAEYRKSVEISEKTLSDHPGDVSSAVQAMAAEQSLAKLLAALGQRDAAVSHARHAAERAERMARETPMAATSMRLAASYAELGAVQKLLGNWADAHEAGVRAAEEWRRAIGDRKGDPHLKDLASVERLIAECDSHLK